MPDPPASRTSFLARAASHALNYAPLNYEWHKIMEIINGVRFADANEPARRFAGCINAYPAVGNPRSPRKMRFNKIVFRNYRRTCRSAARHIHTLRGGRLIERFGTNTRDGKGEFRFHRVDNVIPGERVRMELTVTYDRYYIFSVKYLYETRFLRDSAGGSCGY